MQPDALVNVPDIWNHYTVDGKKLTGWGFATYSIKVKTEEKDQLAIKLDTVSTAYRVYINDTPIVAVGDAGTDQRSTTPRYKPTSAAFTPPGEEFYIIIQESNFAHSLGGLWATVFLGSSEKIDEFNNLIAYRDIFVLGNLILFAFILYDVSVYAAL